MLYWRTRKVARKFESHPLRHARREWNSGGKRADGAWPSAAHHRGESEISGNYRARLGKAHARFRMSVEMLFNNSQNASPSAERFAMCLDKRSFEAYQPFFFLSAQRFFIASDSLLRPAGVSLLRFLEAAILLGAAVFRTIFVDSFSSKLIARLIRSLSLFSSETILSRSNIGLLCG
jgi:hypothetical protein